MSRYFPRHTRDLQAIEPPGLKRLTLSLIEMALIAGVTIRLLRAVVLTYAPTSHWIYLACAFALGAIILFGTSALHLANYTPRRWLWRAPLFGVCEAGAEMAVSAALTIVGREPAGTGLATLSQWWSLAAYTLVSRTLIVCVFAMALAVVVHIAHRVAIANEPNARAAEDLRAELTSEAPEPEIDRSQAF